MVSHFPILDGASDADDLADELVAAYVGDVSVDGSPFSGQDVRVRSADAAVFDLDYKEDHVSVVQSNEGRVGLPSMSVSSQTLGSNSVLARWMCPSLFSAVGAQPVYFLGADMFECVNCCVEKRMTRTYMLCGECIYTPTRMNSRMLTVFERNGLLILVAQLFASEVTSP